MVAESSCKYAVKGGDAGGAETSVGRDVALAEASPRLAGLLALRRYGRLQAPH